MRRGMPGAWKRARIRGLALWVTAECEATPETTHMRPLKTTHMAPHEATHINVSLCVCVCVCSFVLARLRACTGVASPRAATARPGPKRSQHLAARAGSPARATALPSPTHGATTRTSPREHAEPQGTRAQQGAQTGRSGPPHTAGSAAVSALTERRPPPDHAQEGPARENTRRPAHMPGCALGGVPRFTRNCNRRSLIRRTGEPWGAEPAAPPSGGRGVLRAPPRSPCQSARAPQNAQTAHSGVLVPAHSPREAAQPVAANYGVGGPPRPHLELCPSH